MILSFGNTCNFQYKIDIWHFNMVKNGKKITCSLKCIKQLPLLAKLDLIK